MGMGFDQELLSITKLYNAAFRGQTEKVGNLLKKGYDIKAKYINGCTALHIAALIGHTTTAKFLLDNGANIEARDKSGKTALDKANERGHKQIVNLLKKAASNASLENSNITKVELYHQKAVI